MTIDMDLNNPKDQDDRSLNGKDPFAGLTVGTAGAVDQSLPRMLYEQLRANILVGKLRAGQVLRQEELAQRFNVSRVPLREALSQLEADGLIEYRPRRGYAVAALDPEEIVELFELRAVIEEHAGRVAAQSRTQENVAEVERIVDAMDALDVHAPDFSSKWTLLNYELHQRIISSSRRKRLTKIAAALRSTTEPYVAMEIDLTGDAMDAGRQHREMLEAFRAGDTNGLAELSRAHVESTARRLLKGLRSRTLSSNTTASTDKD
jgi:DNA-binding GntR family transcriptional regulator